MVVTWLPWLLKLKRTFYDGYRFEYLWSFLAPWRRTLQGIYFENKQGGAIDDLGGTSGGDAWSNRQVRARA